MAYPYQTGFPPMTDDTTDGTTKGNKGRIIQINLDQPGNPRLTPEAEHERSIAIYDLIESNSFALPSQEGAKQEDLYHLVLRSDMRHIHFDIRSTNDEPLAGFFLAMGPFRRIIRDYALVCDSYYEAIRTKTPSQIQAIDMGRRSLHNEGSELLQARLEGKVMLDHDTARRLFSLICVLKARGV